MAAIAGQPSPKPGSLIEPVPGNAQEQEMLKMLEEINSQQPQTSPGAESLIDESNFVNQVSGNEPTPVAGATPNIGADQFAPEPGFVEANVNQFQDFATRLQANLGANDTERLGFLKKKFGENNATMKDGALYFRRGQGEKFKKLDPDTFELFNDVLADFSREAVTEAALLPSEITGTAAFAPLGPAGMTAGAISGRVAGTPMANSIADYVAQAAGVPQDPTRNKYTENIVGMGAEAVAPYVGKRLMKMIPGTSEAKLAYEAAKKAGKGEMFALSQESEEVAKSLLSLQNEGRAYMIPGEAVGMPGVNVSLTNYQLAKENPILEQFGLMATQDPRYSNFLQKQGQGWGDLLQDTMAEIGRRNVKGPYKPETLAMSVNNAIKDTVNAEGKEIGGFVKKAMEETKNTKLPLNQNTVQHVQGLLSQLGFKPKTIENKVITAPGRVAQRFTPGGAPLPQGKRVTSKLSTKWVPPSDQEIMKKLGTLGITDKGQYKAVINTLSRVSDSLEGGATLQELQQLRGVVGDLVDPLRGSAAHREMAILAQDVRETFKQGVEAGLVDEVDRNAFRHSMSEYSDLMKNMEVLKKGLEDTHSVRAIVNSVFKGKESEAQVDLIKRFAPEAMPQLKEAFMEKLIVDYTDKTKATGFKADKLLNDIEKTYGNKFLSKVFDDGPGPNLQTLKNILNVNNRINETFKKASIDKLSEKQSQGIVDAFIGAGFGIKFKAINGLVSILKGMSPKDRVLLQVLDRGNIDKYVANYPGKIEDKAGLAKTLKEIVATNRVAGIIERGAESAQVPRAIKRATVSGAQEMVSGD